VCGGESWRRILGKVRFHVVEPSRQGVKRAQKGKGERLGHGGGRIARGTRQGVGGSFEKCFTGGRAGKEKKKISEKIRTSRED